MASGRIFLPGWMPAVDSDGNPIPNVRAFFYQNGTDILASVYADAELATPLTNPVEANSSGRFPQIYASDAVLYSASVEAPYGPAGQPFTFDGLQVSQYTDLIAVNLADAAADRAEAAAELAEAAAGAGTGSGLEFLFVGDGTDTTFAMAEPVQAGNEFTVRIEIAGVTQNPGVDYFCDGSNIVTFGTAPENGAEGYGVHVGSSVGVSIVQPGEQVVANGRRLTTASRFARLPDLYDFSNIYLNSVQNDGPGLASAFAAKSVITHASGVLRIATDTTIPSGSCLKVLSGQINVLSGATLTFAKGAWMEAPPSHHVFIGSGDVRGIPVAYVENFGAVGDYDESQPDGGSPTNDGPAFERAVEACTTVRLQAKAYAVGNDVSAYPTLQRSYFIEGVAASIAGAGSRIYDIGCTTSCIAFVGTLSNDDPSANADYGMKNVTIAASVGAGPIGLRIQGQGGPSNKTLRSLTGAKFENVVVNEFSTNVLAYSFFNVTFDGSRIESQTNAGISIDLGVTAGGSVSSEFNLIRTKVTQPTSAPGVAVKLTVSDGTATNAVELRGIKFDTDTQIYAGTGYCIDALVIGKAGKTRTMGDFYINPGCALQGDTNITSNGAVRFVAQDGGALSSIHLKGVQVESSEGPAVSFQITNPGGTFGTIHTVSVDSCTFRYNEGRSIQLDGVKGFRVTNNDYAFCGITGSPVAEHIWINNGVAGRIENNIATAKDASAWPGLATGITIAGTTTNVLTRANALGTTTARTGGTDSADQPSTTVQV